MSLAAVYCGSLVASMALARREKIHFETLEDLVSQTEYKWGYVSGTYLDSVLQVYRPYLILTVSYSFLYYFILFFPFLSFGFDFLYYSNTAEIKH